MALTILVAYDISDDGVRSRCAAMLQSVGNRIQRSVYVCIVDFDQLAELRSRISALIDHERDMVSFFRQCKDCWGEGISLGAVAPVTTTPYWVAF
ncbi:CRISPR-associated endonuclease Cas2 [Microbacterium sp.]|uniref:CRISPR-associated endonuclease Cas2 n=1 Tax=Microbacterium sp. TaxID=51671 RepID=UPI0039E3D999